VGDDDRPVEAFDHRAQIHGSGESGEECESGDERRHAPRIAQTPERFKR
jgi:hypothetical protein